MSITAFLVSASDGRDEDAGSLLRLSARRSRRGREVDWRRGSGPEEPCGDLGSSTCHATTVRGGASAF